MKQKMNFTAIIAVTMIAMSVLVLGSCNADDDDYNFEYGTLANGVMTRSGDSWGDTISNRRKLFNVMDKTFQIIFDEKNDIVTISVEIDVDISTQKNICRIKRCDGYDTDRVSATAKNFDFVKRHCDMEIVINSVEYGKGKGRSERVHYTE